MLAIICHPSIYFKKYNERVSRDMNIRRMTIGMVASLGLWLVGESVASAQLTVSTNSVADAFVRSADPTHNYGGAGALSVSGTIATNASGAQMGSLDSFMRFDISSSFAQFNTTFGVGD